ncbi:MAG: hypothetical protein CBD57_03125 [Candidatus Pelagibacter sp. TMED197]|nr:MAG: hypothetical protein CBD57_03125 [Candidatus Pelagibacter sp. TMED197]|tara:strand:+ start:1816 stop:3669 length:1854 start_codon:yes stop_codon:yes gene_type:complete
MANSKLIVSDLDFNDIKRNLKTFLQSQSQFQDYDFEGSSLAILLDILSYNTHYMAYLANMATNELYLDSADIRNNIVSLAKMLGYTPSSPRAPKASINLVVNNGTGTSITMAKGTVFNSSVSDSTYQYITNEDITTTPANGVYTFSDVTLYEGTLVKFKYTVDETDVDQRFIIPSANTDTSTLKITVQNSATDTTSNTYSLSSGYSGVKADSKVYFIQEGSDGKFQVYFGDGVTGNKLVDGNIVILEYIVTNKTDSNGAKNFTLQGSVGGFTDVSITTNSVSQGGSEAEDNESVKFNAPLNFVAQDRAVTTTDYETLVQQIYPNALSVSAWGGEDDETPRYGIVKIAIKAGSGSTLTDQTKLDIVNGLKPYNVASVKPEIVDPETTSVLLTSNIKYNANSTTKSKDTLKSDIISTITNYNTSSLQKFDGVYRHSKITGLIDDTDASILSNTTTIKIRKSLTPVINSATKYDVYFRNALYNPHSGHNTAAGGILSSTGFKVSGDNNEMFLDDDGNGNVRRYYLVSGVKTYADSTQGTINYTNGQVTLNLLNVASISNIRGASSTIIEITVQPSSNDVVPVRDQIVEIDVSNSIVIVEEDTFVGGSAEAGVGYSTSSSY